MFKRARLRPSQNPYLHDCTLHVVTSGSDAVPVLTVSRSQTQALTLGTYCDARGRGRLTRVQSLYQRQIIVDPPHSLHIADLPEGLPPFGKLVTLSSPGTCPGYTFVSRVLRNATSRNPVPPSAFAP